MKKTLIVLGIIICFVSRGQTPTYQQKLYYTCKVWGFVKYFHSNVSVCRVNWDSVLIHCLPLIKNAATDSAFNNALDTMLFAAGPMIIATTPTADTMAPELKRNLNFGWINDPIFNASVQTILDTISSNFRPHNECWVENNPRTNSNDSYLIFPYDSLMLNQNMGVNFPDEWHRLLILFKHWNIINYFNPYNYTHTIPWDTVLYQNVLSIDSSNNDLSFYIAFRKITAANDDAHTEGLTQDGYQGFPYGYYSAQLVLKYIPNGYIVVQSGVRGITIGDKIISVDGLTPAQWEDSLKPYISAGDSAAFKYFISTYMLTGNYGSSADIIYQDSSGKDDTIMVPRNVATYSSWFFSYFPNDTLATVHWRLWNNCNIGYVNMGELETSDIGSMYRNLYNTSAIIFDIRNYPNETEGILADYMFPRVTIFAKFLVPDIAYPGTFYWQNDSLGINGNPTPYKGKIILLFNEQTVSQAEFTCMILQAMPNVITIGSQTQGTDGNISYYRPSQYQQTGFTSLGVFYPNGDSTERVGIIPDTLIYPTQNGIRAGRDEVLEKALDVAGCPLGIPNIQSSSIYVNVYPNPTLNEVFVKANNLSTGKVTLTISDITGRILLEKQTDNSASEYFTELNINQLATGIYMLGIKTTEQQIITKIIKQ
ncbi:MAG: T9SS type A sorting domain-containing protein [Bacteroidia bacterium]